MHVSDTVECLVRVLSAKKSNWLRTKLWCTRQFVLAISYPSSKEAQLPRDKRLQESCRAQDFDRVRVEVSCSSTGGGERSSPLFTPYLRITSILVVNCTCCWKGLPANCKFAEGQRSV